MNILIENIHFQQRRNQHQKQTGQEEREGGYQTHLTFTNILQAQNRHLNIKKTLFLPK